MPAFDPYHKWLGISPKDQPPNHYRLLGIDEFEGDPDVIAAAADRQMAYVRQCASGEFADYSQKLLSELAIARLDLLNSQKKAEYDVRLRWQFRPRENVSDSRESIIEFQTLEESTIAEPPLATPRASEVEARSGTGPHPHAAKSVRPKSRFSWLWSVLLLLGATGLIAVAVGIATKPAIVGKPPDTTQMTDRPDSNSEEGRHASATPIEVGQKPGESKPADLERAEPEPPKSKPAEPTPDESTPDESMSGPPDSTEPEPAESTPPEPKPAEPDSKDTAIVAAPPVKMPAARTRADLNGRVAGEEWDGNGLKIRYCWCPPGRLTMGSPASEKGRGTNEAQAQVRLTDGFWLGKTEVTRRVWLQVMNWRPSSAVLHAGDDTPASGLSWNDATEFCKKLNARERGIQRLPTGWKYDLPTEAQWEYACRAGTRTKYSCGDDASRLGECAWFDETTSSIGANGAQRVGQKKPNAWGLQDMHGNVCEWCRDAYQERLPGGSDPLVDSGGWSRVLRGGGWNDPQVGCRSAYREARALDSKTNYIGFRIAIVRSGE